MDKRLQELKRRLESEPENPEASMAYIRGMAQIQGPNAYLEALYDRSRWKQSSQESQDLAIEEVKRRLGPSFVLDKVALYPCQELQHRIATFRHKPSQLLLQLLPGGPYQRGFDDELAYHREGPVHTVTVPPFLLGQYPVRQSIWERSGLANHSRFRDPERPVERVSFAEVQRFLDHFGFRLPSEAEWEYACRAGEESEFFWGDSFNEDYCWHDNNCQSTMPVTAHQNQFNAFGLIDMLGQVWEWCADHYLDSYHKAPRGHQPYLTEPQGSSWTQAIRGASWTYPRAFCRSSFRFPRQTISETSDLGFRVALDIPMIEK